MGVESPPEIVETLNVLEARSSEVIPLDSVERLIVGPERVTFFRWAGPRHLSQDPLQGRLTGGQPGDVTRRDGDDPPLGKMAQQSDMVVQEGLEGLARRLGHEPDERDGRRFLLMKMGSF